MSTRDDDAPHRGAQKPTSRTAAEGQAAPNEDSASGGGAGSGAQGDTTSGPDMFGSDKHVSSTFESSAIALGEVIDKSTIEGMLRLSRSADPKQRAEAARMARDAVAKRLELLKKKREAIEKRAKQLKH